MTDARSRRAGRATSKNGISGAAALIGAAALLVTAAPAHAAGGGGNDGPAEVIPGKGTSTPALVDGIREAAASSGSAADAARGHLAGKRGRYRIAEPARDLKPVQTLSSGASETVRLQQKHQGVDVLGGQYVVRMEHKNGKRVVTGTSGKYFTGLKADTRAEVSEKLAVERAVAATLHDLVGKRLAKGDAARTKGAAPAARSLTGTARGLVVVPKGPGVLTHHVTVRGTDPATGHPVLREVYVDAKAGYPVLQYSGIKTFGTDPGTGAEALRARARAAAADTSKAAARAAAGPVSPGVTGSGVKYDGTTVELGLVKDTARNEYVMTDHARMWDSSKNPVTTWDARGKEVSEVEGRWPDGIKEFGSPTPSFGKDATEAGAVDAHWAAGKVYDYYKKVHGRDSLDGRGMAINSLVGVTEFGGAYVNAFWDGTKMVYGGGDQDYKTLSADLDVVGHEMTHGVVEHTADLVYAGQSGALNEALADYFGNAIAVDAAGTAMDDPDAGLLGGNLCRTKTPRQCAFRDLNDGHTTSKNFLGVGFGTDNGGVHLNSTIFSGALWDIREDLGRTLADKIVYKALAEYMTPLDGFTEGRDAVIAAAKALGVSAKDLNVVQRSFNAHGVVPNWEQALGVDTDVLSAKLNTTGTEAGAGGGWWTASRSNDDGSEAYSVWAGRVDGSGAPKLISPNDGRYHVSPATDGKTVAWVAYGKTGTDVLSRPLAGGPVKKLYSTDTATVYNVRVEAGTVVFDSADLLGGRHVGYVRTGDRQPTWVDGDRAELSTALPSLSGGRMAYATLYPEGDDYRVGTEVLDLATGKKTLMGQLGKPENIGQTGINATGVFWLVDETPDDKGQVAVRRAKLDGTGVADLSPEKGAGALRASELTASESAVTVTDAQPDAAGYNESLPKLWQFAADGSSRARVSCNRGEQSSPAAAGGKQVVWIDGTTSSTDLVTRTRPAGTCS
ncbi:peptidase M4 family protein [Streptosporangium nondiastaticum]|uniref:Peptidase M4 family protein n=1 Tax=Streptosporangium nondiastaticum TaxID=35764 RepID=A0A9X7JKD4_9ACTN|nr:M4 family metallopeptidase [Streptosporangium nondiastaticum]PSJ25290.1 peptidase M4 family protein [Streptosporangium nondiastaticum]